MKSRILFVLLCVWTAIIMFTMPICIGWIYMNITGHAKGYAYNLGSETSVSIMMGIIELIIWGVLAIPSTFTLCRKVAHINKRYLFFMMILILFLFVGGILLMGGWHEFIQCFGLS